MKAVLRLTFCLLLFGNTLVAAPRIAPTDALPPAEQKKKFKLPPGFEIQLIVSEPAIGQPMNLNFDARGRLWITHSVEYPYPAKGDVARDALTIVEGIGPDGKPQRVSRFAEQLNIPIGQTPIGDGSEAVFFSIPNIYRAADKDGDGKGDERKLLYGRIGNVDTHGMANAFTPWIDGWIYGCHGFRNDSEVKDASGNVVKMNSGNTYRFKADGSHFQQFTWGQVNPFGITFDPLGNHYTSDCHSKPVYMMLRGAYYPSFGKPHDGLGFAPDMIAHGHGSTGICGPAYYAADHFPPKYRDNLFICNPVNSMVHRDKFVERGSTNFCETQPDFITCEDLWFRPVDAIVGPDGALYIADFYNAVIGHYEVPLQHPKRDRRHGRVWRIVYRGTDGKAQSPAKPVDLTKLSVAQLVDRLADPNLLVRTLATNLLVERFPKRAPELIRKVLNDAPAAQHAHGLWALERLGAIRHELLDALASKGNRARNRLVRVHAVRILAERNELDAQHKSLVIAALSDKDAFVRRAAADAMGQHVHPVNIAPLLHLLSQTPPEDTHLIHVAKMALRNQLVGNESIAALGSLELSKDQAALVASVAIAVKSPAAAALLLKHLQQHDVQRQDSIRLAEHIARYGSADSLEQLAQWIQRTFEDDIRYQYEQLLAIRAALETRGVKNSAAIQRWARKTAGRMLKMPAAGVISWRYVPPDSKPDEANPFAPQPRDCDDGQRAALLHSSHPRGEQLTGVYRSDAFAPPENLTFFVAGHNGHPDQPDVGLNLVRLRDAASGRVIAETKPPRNDVARRVDWTLAAQNGKPVYVEIVDGHSGGAYAWLAAGRFSVAALNPAQFSPHIAGADLVAKLGLKDLEPQLQALLKAEKPAIRAAAAEALAKLQPDSRAAALVVMLRDAASSGELSKQICAALLTRETNALKQSLLSAFRAAAGPRQLEMAKMLAADAIGAEALLDLARSGAASPRLLTRPTVRQKLDALKRSELQKQIDELTAALPAEDAALAKLITERRQQFTKTASSASAGVAVYKKHCAACHRIANEGEMVGPQLDGIGSRGLDRLLEDILDPNRNVDPAFRTSTIELSNGKIVTGLVRREEGTVVVLADQLGKEFNVPKKDVVEITRSPLSLMPANWSETISPQDFGNLLAFLLAHRSQPTAGATQE